MVSFLTQISPILDFRSVLQQWQFAGIFDIMLPFLLIFSLVFAILEKSKILGKNKGVYAIISLSIGFFAISNEFVTGFFAILFSNAALGFAVILVLLIFLGFFIGEEGKAGWLWVGSLFAIIVFFWVLNRSLIDSGLNFIAFDFFYQNPFLWSSLVYGGAILIVIFLVVFMVPQKDGDVPPLMKPVFKRLGI